MGIYLLSLSHKTAPLAVRSLFAYTEPQKEGLLRELTAGGLIDEAVVLATCNRTEIYCHSAQHPGRENRAEAGGETGDGALTGDAFSAGDLGGGNPANEILEIMERAAVRAAGAESVPDMGRYIRRYCGRKAVHHLFRVAAGLDSMVIGEDQILGQVKEAYDFARERGCCRTCFNTLFRDAVTGAKKVKTDTLLSKTPVSTASLAVKAAEEHLGGLDGKKMMIIGATGKIGGIVLKNIQRVKGLDIYVTLRSHASAAKLGHGLRYTAVDYEDRYRSLGEMDVILSATASPHYTVTAEQAAQSMVTGKPRVFLDLAVPSDIEETVGDLPGALYFNMEHMTEAARLNNERKQAEVDAADRIIGEYESQFYKWLLFQNHRADMDALKETVVRDACEKGVEAAVDRLFYRIRESGTAEEVDHFLAAVQSVNADLTAAAEARPTPAKKREKAEQTAYFPLFFNLNGQSALIVGAGKIAARRAEILAEFGAAVSVVAPDGAELMERLAREGAVLWERRKYVPEDVDDRYLVIAATGDKALNAEIVVRCRQNNILVNNAGDKSQCDFYFPGIAREGGVVAGVTTSGKDHALAREITGQMQMWLSRTVK